MNVCELRTKHVELVLIRENPETEILLPPEKNQLVSPTEILTESQNLCFARLYFDLQKV